MSCAINLIFFYTVNIYIGLSSNIFIIHTLCYLTGKYHLTSTLNLILVFFYFFSWLYSLLNYFIFIWLSHLLFSSRLPNTVIIISLLNNTSALNESQDQCDAFPVSYTHLDVYKRQHLISLFVSKHLITNILIINSCH